MTREISGISSLAYKGTNAANPPNWFIYTRNPTASDTRNVSLGDLWLNKITKESWCLVSLSGNISSKGNLIAEWIKISTIGNNVTVTGNTGGGVTPSSAGNINLLGDGTTVQSFGNPPVNTLILSLIGSSGNRLTLTGDTGGPIHSGVGNNLFFLGNNGLTVGGIPGSYTLSIGAENIATEFDTDAGSAVPVGGALNIAGGLNIGTTGSADIVTSNLDTTLAGIINLTVDNLTVTNGAQFDYLTQGVLQSDGSGNITSSKGTDGQLLIGSTAGAPSWASITAGTNISIINGPNSITINKSASSTNAWVLIETINNYTGVFRNLTTAYKTYVLVIHKIMLNRASSANVLVQLSSDNGLTFYTTGYTSGLTARLYRGTFAPYPITSTANNGHAIAYLDGSFGLYQNTACTTYLYDLAGSGNPKLMSSMFTSGVYGANNNSFGYASGVFNGLLSGPVNAINVTLSSPPFTVGPWINSMSLYGLNS